VSLNKVTDGDHEDQLAFELPRAKAAWPAWVLAAALLVLGAVQMATVAAGQSQGLSLSMAALQRGQWWTGLTQMFVQHTGFTQIIAIGLVVALGVATLGARDPHWMGGWRTLAVYVACGLAAAAVHLLSGSPGALAGVWPALLGLGAFYFTSGRSEGLQRPPDIGIDEGRAGPDRDASGTALQWFLMCVLIGSTDVFEHAESLVQLQLTWPIDLAIAIGGAVIAYVIERWAPKPVRLLTHAAFFLVYVLVGLLMLSSFLRTAVLPWEGWVAGIAMGVVLGGVERALRLPGSDVSAA